MKVLIIGNSHVGSLKRGYDLFPEELKKKFELFFLAARGNELKNLKVTSGLIFSDELSAKQQIKFTYGHEQLDLNKLAPDYILMYGLDIEFPYKFFSDCMQKNYSTKFGSVCFDDLTSGWGFSLAKQIRENYQGHIAISSPLIAKPFGTENSIQCDNLKNELENILIYANKNFYNTLGLNYFLQPFSTFDIKSMMTFHKYTVGSTRLAIHKNSIQELHPTDDVVHMNDMFGNIFLRGILRKFYLNKLETFLTA